MANFSIDLHKIASFFAVKKVNAHEDEYLLMEECRPVILKMAKKMEVEGGRIGVYIKAMNSCNVISYDPSSQFNVASVIKIAAMTAAFSAMENSPLTFSQEDIAKINELVEKMIVKSDNGACKELLEFLYQKMGNGYFDDYLKSTGLTHTNRAVSCVNDISLLLEKIYKKELFAKVATSDKCIALLRRTIYRDRIPKGLPEEIQGSVANKTGTYMDYSSDFKYLDITCNDAGIVFTPKGAFIICVMIEFTIPCGPEITADSSQEEKNEFLAKKVKELIPKGSETIRNMASCIYYRCFSKGPSKPEAVI